MKTKQQTGFTIVISELETGKAIVTLDQVPVTAYRINDVALTPKQATGLEATVPLAHSTMKLTDAKISENTLKGVKVTISSTNSPWSLQSVSMAAIVTTSSKISSMSRSYLRDPEHFDKVYRNMVEVLLQPNRERNLTAAIMHYLSKLVHFDSRFVKLISGALDLRQFVLTNIVINNQEHINASAEFLRTLSTEDGFARKVYEILIELISIEFTRRIPPKNGYDAIVGMMHWAAPLDAQRSLLTLFETLYQRICLQSLKSVQASDQCVFRTRFSRLLSDEHNSLMNFLDHYPFDSALFKQLGTSKEMKEAVKKACTNSLEKAKVLKNVEWSFEREAAERKHVYSASFTEVTRVDQLRIYFDEQRSNEQHRLDVFVKVDGVTKSHLQLEEQEFARFAYPRKPNTSKSSKQTKSHEALVLNVGITAKSLEVKIIFGHTASSLPNHSSKSPLPETLIEAYGDEAATAQAGYKEARTTFMASMAGRLRKIGNSVRMAA